MTPDVDSEGIANVADLTPLEARRRLGRYLFELLDRADPSPDWSDFAWDELTPEDRHLYIDIIAYLMERKELVEKALMGSDLLLHSYEEHQC